MCKFSGYSTVMKRPSRSRVPIWTKLNASFLKSYCIILIAINFISCNNTEKKYDEFANFVKSLDVASYKTEQSNGTSKLVDLSNADRDAWVRNLRSSIRLEHSSPRAVDYSKDIVGRLQLKGADGTVVDVHLMDKRRDNSKRFSDTNPERFMGIFVAFSEEWSIVLDPNHKYSK